MIVLKRLLFDESGATSVLIIFMMLMLVILGAYSIASAHVNYTFSNRALEWKQGYYGCDSMAEGFLADVDGALAKAEKAAVEAVIGANAVISQDNNAFISSGGVEESLTKLYTLNVLKEFELLSDKYDIQINENGPDVGTVISSGGNTQIEVRVAALPPRYSIALKDGVVSGVLKGKSKRYKITQWRESEGSITDIPAQEPLWDGIVR